MKLSLSETERLIWMIKRNDWLGVKSFAIRMLRAGSSVLMKKYKRPVERIESHFSDSNRRPPWPPEWSSEKVFEHKKLIAWYICKLGNAGPLIADITEARKNKPRSLAYFLVTYKGKKASRWDLLLNEHRLTQWDKTKTEENRIAEELAEKSNVKPSYDPLQDFWIRSARSEFLAAVKSGNLREAEKIARKVHAQTGVNLAEELKPVKTEYDPADELKL